MGPIVMALQWKKAHRSIMTKRQMTKIQRMKGLMSLTRSALRVMIAVFYGLYGHHVAARMRMHCVSKLRAVPALIGFVNGC